MVIKILAVSLFVLVAIFATLTWSQKTSPRFAMRREIEPSNKHNAGLVEKIKQAREILATYTCEETCPMACNPDAKWCGRRAREFLKEWGEES